MWILSGNTNEIGNAGESPKKSFLFFLTKYTDPGIGLTGDRVCVLGKTFAFGTLWCAFDGP